jgi:hypothetical protein
MKNQNKISREEFERNFEQMNASWNYEGAALDKAGKELLFKRLNGDITEAEFHEEVKKRL